MNAILRNMWKREFKTFGGFKSSIKELHKDKKIFSYRSTKKGMKNSPFSETSYFSISKEGTISKTKTRKKDITSAQLLADTLLKITLTETKKRLDLWIDQQLTQNLKKYISEQVEKEFSEEVLPVLLKKLDIHVKQLFVFNKRQVLKTMVEAAEAFISTHKKG